MSVLPEYKCLYASHMQCLQRPEEGVKSSGSGAICDIGCMWVLGAESEFSVREVSVLSHGVFLMLKMNLSA